MYIYFTNDDSRGGLRGLKPRMFLLPCPVRIIITAEEEVSITGFYELCKSPFLTTCLLASLAAEVNRTAGHSTEERGGVSRAH